MWTKWKRLGGLSVLIAVVGMGAGCGGSSPTEPSPPEWTPSQPPIGTPPQVIYTTLNPPDSRGPFRLFESRAYINYLNAEVLGGTMVDDFTPTVSTQVRTIRWQGGYCDPRYQVPRVIPGRVAQSFRITFISDRNGFPDMNQAFNSPLREAVFTPAEAHEEFMFDVANNPEWGCGSKDSAPFAYYSYSATLSAPLRVEAGQKYWLRIIGDIGRSDLVWGWRGGTGGDSRSYPALYIDSWFLSDMAFSLSD